MQRKDANLSAPTPDQHGDLQRLGGSLAGVNESNVGRVRDAIASGTGYESQIVEGGRSRMDHAIDGLAADLAGYAPETPDEYGA